MKNILEYIENSAKCFPNNIAIEDDKESIRYSELELYSKKIGSALLALKQKNKPVVILMEKSVKCYEAMFGIVYSGNFYVVIDSKAPEERIQKVMHTLNAIAYIVSKTDDVNLSTTIQKLYLEDLLLNNVEFEGLRAVRSHTIDTDPLYALFTSGSTGVPKGAVISHKSVIAYAEWITDTFGVNQDSIFGSQTPFYFSMSVLEIFSAIKNAAKIQIIPKQLFSFPIKLVEYMNIKKINTIYWVPSALCIVANSRVLDYICPQYLKTILFAGEVMPTKQFNIWRKHYPQALFANLFGPTEITDIGIFYIVERELDDNEPIPIGSTCDNIDAFLLNEKGEEVNGNEIGELYFRGSFLAAGYYNNCEKTKECFVQNPLNKFYPEIVYKTGDLVRRNEYGEYVYCGRKDFQIKHMGYRIELGEIENAVNSLDYIDNCVCLYDTNRNEIVLVYTGKNAEDKLIMDGVRNKIPPYMYPNRLIKRATLQYNANGKIDRLTLKKEILGE